MALLWFKQDDDSRYEVRSAGKTLRLYTDGVFHSQYNPDNIVTGSVWDLLMLPALLLPLKTVHRVLVLGVGGGAVIQQLNTLLDPQRIVGIELNPVHLLVARRFFQLKGNNIALYEADAVEWVKAYHGPGFDVIIDDLFCGEQGEATRAVNADERWFKRLLRLLNPGGEIVVNFASTQQLRGSAYVQSAELQKQFAVAYRFTTPYCENAVAAFLTEGANSCVLKQQIARLPLLANAERLGKLRYNLSRI